MVSTTTSETCSIVHKCMERVINTDTNLVVNVNMTSQREVFFWWDGNSWWVDERIKRLLKIHPVRGNAWLSSFIFPRYSHRVLLHICLKDRNMSHSLWAHHSVTSGLWGWKWFTVCRAADWLAVCLLAWMFYTLNLAQMNSFEYYLWNQILWWKVITRNKYNGNM